MSRPRVRITAPQAGINGRRSEVGEGDVPAAFSSLTSIASLGTCDLGVQELGLDLVRPALGLANLTTQYPRPVLLAVQLREQLSFTDRGNDRDLPRERLSEPGDRARVVADRDPVRVAGEVRDGERGVQLERGSPLLGDRHRGDADGSIGDRSALDDGGSLRHDVEVERPTIEQILLRGGHGHVSPGARRLAREVVGSLEDEVGATVGRGGGGPGPASSPRSSRLRSIGVCACGASSVRSRHRADLRAGRAVPGTVRGRGG